MTSQQDSRPWARHYQDDWLNKAGDRDLPNWLRVACLAYGSHANNGHAVFQRGAIALVLGQVDQKTGEVVPLVRQRVHEAVRQAVRHGWLAEGSMPRCLIVPAHTARKGKLDDPAKPCPIHIKRRK